MQTAEGKPHNEDIFTHKGPPITHRLPLALHFFLEGPPAGTFPFRPHPAASRICHGHESKESFLLSLKPKCTFISPWSSSTGTPIRL